MQVLILFLVGLAMDFYLYVKEGRAKGAKPNAQSAGTSQGTAGCASTGNPVLKCSRPDCPFRDV